ELPVAPAPLGAGGHRIGDGGVRIFRRGEVVFAEAFRLSVPVRSADLGADPDGAEDCEADDGGGDRENLADARKHAGGLEGIRSGMPPPGPAAGADTARDRAGDGRGRRSVADGDPSAARAQLHRSNITQESIIAPPKNASQTEKPPPRSQLSARRLIRGAAAA